jgi:hypothetical protein
MWVAPNHKGIFVVPLKTRGGHYKMLKKHKALFERVSGEPMLILGVDRGELYASEEVKNFCTEHGIELDPSAPGASAGSAETYLVLLLVIGIVQDRMRASMNRAGVGKSYWLEALYAVVHATDLMPCEPLGGISMYENRTGRRPPLHRMHPLGAWAAAHIPESQRRKGENRGREAMMLGPAVGGADGFRLENLANGSLFHSRSVTVLPKIFPKQDRKSVV